MTSLALSVPAWDLTLDSSGNIALSSGSYAILQDVSSAVRVYLGECYYDIDQGIAYDANPESLDLSFLEAEITEIAQNVTGVAACEVDLYPLKNRGLGGMILIKTNNNETIKASL